MKQEEALTKIGTDLQAEALGYPAAARQLIVTNDKELKAIDEFVKGGKALQKEIRAGYDDIINDWHKGWKNSIAKRDYYLKPVSDGVEIAQGKMVPYMQEQARKRREAEEAARKAQEEAQAALRRAQEEAKAKALAIEEEKQRKAREALHDGELEKAEKILEEKKTEVAPVKTEDFLPEEVVIPEKVELKGTHMRTTWGWELEDFDQVPREWLCLDPAKITAYVRTAKEKAKIPGIRIFPKTGMASKGGG